MAVVKKTRVGGALLGLAALATLGGCPQSKPAPDGPGLKTTIPVAPTPPPSPPPIDPGPEEPVNGGRPQEGLPTIALRVGDVDIEVEVANTQRRREIGLMYRMAMPINRGMLFVYPGRDYRSFWMKNTLLPLSLAYIRDDGSIAEVVEMTPADPKDDSPPTYPSDEPVRYCLEMNRGWFAERKLGPGTKVAGLRQARARE